MKYNTLLILVAAITIVSCKPTQSPVNRVDEPVASYDSTDRTNDFFDNEPVVDLPGSKIIEVTGEVEQPKSIDLAKLPVKSIIVKETILENGEINFVGAYRYDGVSLYDILNQVKVVKKNAKEFNPIIDQYVVVYNAEGDSVVFSWGEIYYPVQRHQILIANQVVRIVPTKSKDKWPLPVKARIIAGSDLITERNIPEPVRIVIRSMSVNYKVDRSIQLWSPAVAIEGVNPQSLSLTELPSILGTKQFEHVFYGRGMGIHGITLTEGASMKDLIADKLKTDRDLIKTGLFAIAGVDGYRCAVTYSELMNRNDNGQVIIQDRGDKADGGRFSCLITADFFSDRAIKSISEIRLVQGLKK
jgi:hypothetical protein